MLKVFGGMLVYFEGMLRFGVSWDGAVSMHGPNRNMAENLSDYNELHTLSSGRFFLRGTQEWSYGATVLTPQREEGLHEKGFRIEFLVQEQKLLHHSPPTESKACGVSTPRGALSPPPMRLPKARGRRGAPSTAPGPRRDPRRSVEARA